MTPVPWMGQRDDGYEGRSRTAERAGTDTDESVGRLYLYKNWEMPEMQVVY